MIEGMLVSMEHMQIYFVFCFTSCLKQFHRKVIFLAKDLSAFVLRRGPGRGYRVNDRVNSTRGLGEDFERWPLKACELSAANMNEKLARTRAGEFVYAAEVSEVKEDGRLLLKYDIGGQGLELSAWVWACAQAPWHPKDVSLVLNLWGHLARGALLDGLSVRWSYVSRLLSALYAFALNGHVWRAGGD